MRCMLMRNSAGVLRSTLFAAFQRFIKNVYGVDLLFGDGEVTYRHRRSRDGKTLRRDSKPLRNYCLMCHDEKPAPSRKLLCFMCDIVAMKEMRSQHTRACIMGIRRLPSPEARAWRCYPRVGT